jgi:hypothetical protein
MNGPTVAGLKYPTRYDRQAYHAKFGIVNWLTRVGISNPAEQDRLIDKFLELHNFVPKNDGVKDADRVKASFVSNRFGEFTKFVLNDKPAEQAPTW